MRYVACLVVLAFVGCSEDPKTARLRAGQQVTAAHITAHIEGPHGEMFPAGSPAALWDVLDEEDIATVMNDDEADSEHPGDRYVQLAIHTARMFRDRVGTRCRARRYDLVLKP